MNEQNNFTPSELIYLFLDGEADNVQRTVLFTAMASDSNLQEEFHDATRIRAAAQKQALAIVPSALLTQQVFAKAGFGTAAASVKTAGFVASSGGAGTIATLIGSFKGVVAPLLAAAGAAVITGVVMYNANQSKLDTMQSQAKAELASALQQQAAQQQATIASQPVASSATSSPVRIIYRDRPLQQQTSSASTQQSDVTANPPQEAVANSVPVASAAVVTATDSAKPLPQVITPVAYAMPNTQYVVGTSITPVYEQEERSSRYLYDDGMQSRFMVYARGIINAQLYPQRSFESDANALLDNVSIGAMYRLNMNSSLGVEAGQEMFPLYVYNSRNQQYELRPSLLWMGLAYRYVADPEDGFSPFSQIFAGGTRTGPIGKLVLGMQWRADSHVVLSLGVEGTALLYNTAGTLYTAGKLGITPSVAILF